MFQDMSLNNRGGNDNISYTFAYKNNKTADTNIALVQG